MENRSIDGTQLNKIFFQLLQRFDNQATLLEKPVTLIPLSSHPTRIGLLPLVFICKLLASVCSKVVPHRSIPEIDKQLPTSRILWEFSIYQFFLRCYFAYHRPKIILLSNYYNTFNLALIHVARQHDVPTLEFQHGIIHHLHPAYSFPKLKSRELFPDYLAYFMLEKEQDPAFYIPIERIKATGHPYLHYIATQTSAPPAWWQDNKKTILVTLQHGYVQELVQFLVTGAGLDSSFNFILCPRTPDEVIPDSLPSQFYVERELNFYQCIKFADLHCTYASTCALEASMLNIPTVAIALRDIARQYLSPFIAQEKLSFVTEPTMLITACHELMAKNTGVAIPEFDASAIEIFIETIIKTESDHRH